MIRGESSRAAAVSTFHGSTASTAKKNAPSRRTTLSRSERGSMARKILRAAVVSRGSYVSGRRRVVSLESTYDLRPRTYDCSPQPCRAPNTARVPVGVQHDSRDDRIGEDVGG